MPVLVINYPVWGYYEFAEVLKLYGAPNYGSNLLLPYPIQETANAIREKTVVASARVAEAMDAEAGRKRRQSYCHCHPHTKAKIAR